VKKRLLHVLQSQKFKNSFWSLFSTAAYPLLLIISTRFFISQLGAEQYGIWVLINSTTQLMSVFNLGLGDANIKFISWHQALQNQSEVRNTVTSTFSVSIIILLFSISTGIVLSYLIENENLLNIPDHSKSIAVESIRVAFLLFGLKFVETILLTIFQGFERYDYASFFSFVSRITILSVNAILIYLDYTLVDVFISSCICLVLLLSIEMIFIKRKYNFLSFKISFNRSHLRKIFDFSLWTWFQSAMAIGTTQLDKFIVAYFSGLATLSYYSLGSMLQTQIHSLFVSAASWLFPAVSKKHAKDEPLIEFYNNAQGVLIAFGFFCIITFLCVEKPIVTFWLGPELYAKSIVYIRLFLYYNLFLLLNIIPYFFLNGTGHVKYNTLSELTTKLLNIVGMIIFFKLWGTPGLVWGLIFSMVVATPIKTSLTKRYALNEKSNLFQLGSIVACSCIILVFETENIVGKALLIVLFLGLFYRIYLHPSIVFKK
jgi:O-antigen/teichoic acid export membrane protein